MWAVKSPPLWSSGESVEESAVQFWRNIYRPSLSPPVALPASRWGGGGQLEGFRNTKGAKHETCLQEIFIEHLQYARALVIQQ